MAPANLGFDLIHEWVLGQALHSVAVLTLFVPLLYIVINEFVRYSARLPGISGPTGLPLVGNLWAVRKNAAEQYRIWSKKYGAVYQVSLGNVPIIVVNSAEAAKGLFAQHSSTLSSRPEFYTFHKVYIRNMSGYLISVLTRMQGPYWCGHYRRYDSIQ